MYWESSWILPVPSIMLKGQRLLYSSTTPLGVRGKEIEVIKDYFKERYTIMNFTEVKKEKMLTIGCPR